MYHLLIAAVPIRINIVFACSAETQMKTWHDLSNRLVWSYLAKDILNLENWQDNKKKHIFLSKWRWWFWKVAHTHQQAFCGQWLRLFDLKIRYSNEEESHYQHFIISTMSLLLTCNKAYSVETMLTMQFSQLMTFRCSLNSVNTKQHPISESPHF